MLTPEGGSKAGQNVEDSKSEGGSQFAVWYIVLGMRLLGCRLHLRGMSGFDFLRTMPIILLSRP